jgi:hypothetical protein
MAPMFMLAMPAMLFMVRQFAGNRLLGGNYGAADKVYRGENIG